MATADSYLDEPEDTSVNQFLDTGGTADSFLNEEQSKLKDTVKSVVETTAMPMRGLRGMAVGAEALVTGDQPILSRENVDQALSRGAAATEPGYVPQEGEQIGAFLGEMTDPRLIPLAGVGAVAVTASRAKKLIAAAKAGGMFGLGSSSLAALEDKGSITMDDAEGIAKSGVYGAMLGPIADAVLGPVFKKLFGSKKVQPNTPEPVVSEPIKREVPKADWMPTAAARKARVGTPVDEAGVAAAENSKDLDELIQVRDKMKPNETALSPESKALLSEIEVEVERLGKLDKTYTSKQALKEFGINEQELTPAAAEFATVKVGEFRPAMRSKSGVKVGQPGDLHGDIPRVRGEESEAGYVDSAGKFFTREEAAKAINPQAKPGEALHSPELKKQQAAEPVPVVPDETKLKDLKPAIQAKGKTLEGDHDALVEKLKLDVVADNVTEGYIDKSGKFITKEEALGPTESKPGKLSERGRKINEWATDVAQAAHDLGYKTTEEALAWAKKAKHFLPKDYELALRNKFVSLQKQLPKPEPQPLPPSKASVSATPIEIEGREQVLKASEMQIKPAKLPDVVELRAELPPEAGINPVVADVLDSARKEAVGRKPAVSMDAQYDGSGSSWKSFKIKEAAEYKPVEPPTPAEVKVRADTKQSKASIQTGVPDNLLLSSPDLPGTELAPALIPEYVAGTTGFRASWHHRIGMATQTALEKMGPGGQELAARIKLSGDASLIRSNNFLYGFDQYLKQIPKNEWKIAGEALADNLEGKTHKYVLPQGLLDYTQKMFGAYADDAKALNMTILRSDGTQVPWAERTNFFPRMIKSDYLDKLMHGDKELESKLAEYFVTSKQSPSLYQATQKVQALRRKFMERRYGHLERAREYDLPPEFYDRQGITVIPEYVKAASHRLEEIRQFGPHDVITSKLLEQIAAENGDAVMARQIFDRYMGLEVSDVVHNKAVQGIRNLAVGMAIQLPSSITQLGQFLTPIHRATTPQIGLGLAKAYGRAAKAMIRSFTDLGKKEAAEAGQGFESAATQYLLDTYGGVKQPFGKFAEKSLQYSGFSGEDTFMRRYSAILGRNHIKDELIPRLLRNPSDNFANIEIRRLGLNPGGIRQAGGLSQDEMNIAVKRFVDQTQGHPDTLSLPLWWSSAQGKFMTQFHTFSVVIGRENFLLAKNMAQTGNVNRLISMGLGTPLVGAGISYIKEELLNLKPTDYTGNKELDTVIKWYLNGTSFGVAADLMLSLSQGRDRFIKAAQIPSIQIMMGLGSDVYESFKGNEKAQLRVAQKIPVVGRVISAQLQ